MLNYSRAISRINGELKNVNSIPKLIGIWCDLVRRWWASPAQSLMVPGPATGLPTTSYRLTSVWKCSLLVTFPSFLSSCRWGGRSALPQGERESFNCVCEMLWEHPFMPAVNSGIVHYIKCNGWTEINRTRLSFFPPSAHFIRSCSTYETIRLL
jgi:hypothetical protein